MPSRSERKVWRSLRKRKGRQATGAFLAEGPKLLGEVLTAGIEIDAVLVAGDAADPLGPLLDEARSRGRRVEVVERRVVAEISDAMTPQPVVTIARIPAWTWDDVGGGPLVLLDGVQDPGNAGTLVRTAIGLGAAAVILLEGSADPWGPKAFRASAGAGLRRPTFRADTPSTIEELRRRKVPIWAASAAGRPLGGAERPASQVAIALGSEAHGVSAALAGASARAVAIEMHAGVESLGVAAAGAILLDRIMNGRPAKGSEDERDEAEEGAPTHAD